MKVIFLADAVSTQRTGIHYYGLQMLHSALRDYPHNDYALVATETIPSLDMRQYIIPCTKWNLRWRQLWQIPKLIRRLKPNLVIELAHFGPFRLPPEIKRATVIHDLTPVIFPKYHSRLSALSHRFLLPGILRKADHIIANSCHTRNDLTSQYDLDPSKITVLYPKIQESKETSLPNLGQLPSKYFLTVGTIEPRKNHLAIIKAFDAFCSENEDIHLVIIGKLGWKYQAFLDALQTAKNHHRIHFLEYVDRSTLWHAYQRAYAFIYASFYEGFGLPVYEAMSFELPVLVARNSSLVEISGGHGLHFEAAQSDTLHNCMRKIAIPATRDKYAALAKERYHEICNLHRKLPFLDLR